MKRVFLTTEELEKKALAKAKAEQVRLSWWKKCLSVNLSPEARAYRAEKAKLTARLRRQKVSLAKISLTKIGGK